MRKPHYKNRHGLALGIKTTAADNALSSDSGSVLRFTIIIESTPKREDLSVKRQLPKPQIVVVSNALEQADKAELL